MLRWWGWRREGSLPDVPKLVIVLAPHTSNWDFAVGILTMYALGVRVSWLGKHTLFRWPAGHLFRWLGGIPVDRSHRSDRTAELAAAFGSRNELALVVTPDGTRRAVNRWKTGFYHVARLARVPVVPIAMDYGCRTIRIGTSRTPTGNPEADLEQIRSFFRGVRGKRHFSFP